MVRKSLVVLSVLRELKEIFEKNGRKSVGILVGKIEGFFRRAAFPFLSQRTSGYSYFLARKEDVFRHSVRLVEAIAFAAHPRPTSLLSKR